MIFNSLVIFNTITTKTITILDNAFTIFEL